MARLILLIVLLALPQVGIAAIDKVSGPITHGANVVLSGSGFGAADISKNTWDDFEDGTVNNTATVGAWANANVLKVSNVSRHPNSHYASIHDFAGEATAGVQGVSTILSQKWFVQYWLKLDSFDWGTGTYGSSSQFLSNVKFVRFWNPGSEIQNIYPIFDWSVYGNSSINIENVPGQTSTRFDTVFSKSSVSDSMWHLLQFEFRDSSVAGAADGVFKVWHNGKLVTNRTGFVGRTNNNLKRPLFIGFYNAWNPGTGETTRSPNLFNMDDVYSSPTLARVEIGDNASYDSCTHREIQIPKTWSDVEIQVKINQGSFANNSNQFIFVVDANGVASDGKQITISDGLPALSAPTGLTVK